MTATIMPPEMLKHLTPDFVAPVVGVLCAPKGPDVTGRLFELGAGFVSEIRWQRAKGEHVPLFEGISELMVVLW
jgi:multifunctional beta-oxidation protein